MTEEEVKPCPSQYGTTHGYIVEVQNDDDIWKELDHKMLPDFQLPRSLRTEGVLEMAGMVGYETAMTLAWAVKACDPYGTKGVRVVPFKIKYSMEAWKEEEKTKELPNFLDQLREDNNLDEAVK